MRPLLRPTDDGAWDELSGGPPESEIDLSIQDGKEGIERRNVLKTQWATYWHYPHGTWRVEEIAAHPEHAAAWRNWLLRRSGEAIASLNGCLVRWSR